MFSADKEDMVIPFENSSGKRMSTGGGHSWHGLETIRKSASLACPYNCIESSGAKRHHGAPGSFWCAENWHSGREINL